MKTTIALSALLSITAFAKSQPIPAIGIAPSHIAADPQHLLNRAKEWEETAGSVNLYKFYVGQLDPTLDWCSHFEPKPFVNTLQALKLENGAEFGDFGFYDGKDEGAKSAADVIRRLQPIFDCGGKVALLHLDGPVRRMVKGVRTTPFGQLSVDEVALDLESVAKELAVFFKNVHAKWPELEIGLIVNLPNWDYNKEQAGSVGGWTETSGLYYEDILNRVYDELAATGENLAFVEIDCPYNYYLRTKTFKEDADCDNSAKFHLIQQWCRERDVKLHIIINTDPAATWNTRDLSDIDPEKIKSANRRFHDGVLAYIQQLHKDDITPDLMLIQSWYRAPSANLPETEPGTFMNTGKEAAQLIRTLYRKKQGSQ